MSKIEQALAKARERGEVTPPTSRGEHGVVARRPAALAAVGEVELRRSRALIEDPDSMGVEGFTQRRLIHPASHHRDVAEAFRQLRTQVLQRAQDRNCTVMVSSVVEDAGNSFVARNLSIAFSFDARKTALLIECSARTDSREAFGVPMSSPGLTDYLNGNGLELERIIHAVQITRLRYIPIGTRTGLDADFFTSAHWRALLRDLKQRYADRYLVIDAPPLGLSADAGATLAECDFVILVVPYGKVTQAQLSVAAKAVGPQKLLGVVLNDEPRVRDLQEGFSMLAFLQEFLPFGRR
jgi:Mrp family chromosome partitioning ATPase